MSHTTLIDAASLQELQRGATRRRPLVVLDCRFDLTDPDAGRRAYRTAHIPGARYADLNRDLASPVTVDSGRHPLPTPAALAEFLAAAGIGPEAVTGGTQAVAYDDANGAFAARAWWLMKWLGFDAVAVLDGGFRAWLAAAGAVESGEPTALDAARAPGHGHPRQHLLATVEEVALALGDPARLVVDARAPERFAGVVEPLDSVAGHIPGALNHPFADNLEPSGRFLSGAELRRRWLARLDGTAPTGMIAMCGSGVTACHNLLAMAVAELPGAKLYAGSWSEWIRNADRPVARGGPA